MAKKGLLYTHCSWAVVSQTGITLCTSLLCGTFQNKLWHRYDDIVDDWLCIQVTATGGNKEKTLEAGIWKKPALGALGSARNINKRNGERHAQVCPFLTSAKKHRDKRCFTLEFRPAHDPVTSWPRPCDQLATVKRRRFHWCQKQITGVDFMSWLEAENQRLRHKNEHLPAEATSGSPSILVVRI